MRRILIVEDEAPIADVVEFAVRKAGFATSRATSIASARHELATQGADLLVLDLGLPDGDGLDLCRELRRSSRVPVLMLTCRDEEVDRVLGLESGADDYVVKPFSPRELVARIRSILRRSQGALTEPTDEVLRRGRVTLIPAEHRVRLDAHEIRLTPVELGLLTVLYRAPARVYSRAALIEQVYQGGFLSERTIDSHIKGIRRKFTSIDATADPIETVFGVGYRARVVT